MEKSETKFISDFLVRPDGIDSEIHNMALREGLNMMQELIDAGEGYSITQFPKFQLETLANAADNDLIMLARSETEEPKKLDDGDTVPADSDTYEDTLEKFFQLRSAARELVKFDPPPGELN